MPDPYWEAIGKQSEQATALEIAGRSKRTATSYQKACKLRRRGGSWRCEKCHKFKLREYFGVSPIQKVPPWCFQCRVKPNQNKK